ncbi:MAG TPA: RHS repeat-associated core domain-containing protein, partial [Blastocatellia bacterium]|nr:RHS repeat-associated core domain-containing protein [Blastocatellia bacterium]
MNRCQHHPELAERLVGDPVDVVTGANVDVNFEFQLPGPLPFTWRRHYDSSKNDRMFALGWGHTHEYDRRLQFDLDGLRYLGPLGAAISFPPLLDDGRQCAAGGFVLQRIDAQRYRIFDPSGPAMEFEFRDAQVSTPVKALRRGQASITFGYGPGGQLESIRDSQGRPIRVENDAKGRILSLALIDARWPAGRVLMSLRYDAEGNLIRGTDTYHNSFSFKYDRNHRLISRTDRRGYTFHFEYDARGRCVGSRGEDGLFEVKLRYLTEERVTIVTRADEGQWTYFYDEHETVTRIIDPYGGVRTFNRDLNGRVTEEIDPNGDVVQWIYGPAGNLLGKRSSLGHFSSDPDGPLRPDQQVHRVPAGPIEWEYGDLSSWLRTESLETDESLRYEFRDHARQLLSIPATPGRGEEERGKIYDLTGCLIKETGETGQPRRWVYDAGGNTQRFHDHDGSTYTYEHVSSNLRSRKIDPLGHAIFYTYTGNVQTASVTDPGGTTNEYVYDLKDRLVQVRRQGLLKEEYRYDDADNLVAKLDGHRKQLLRFEIGPHNLKTVRRLASGENHYFDYDERGYYRSVATDDFKVEFDYDGFGNRIRDERDGLGVRHRFSGFRRLAGTTVLNRFKIGYRFEHRRLVITDPTGREHSLRFSDDGAIVRRMSNGSAELAQYDSAGRCLFKSLTRRYGFEAFWTRAYSYSGEGDLLQVRDNLNGPIRYEYDAAHRLKSRHLHGKQEAFVYDEAGNLLKQPGLDGVSLSTGNRLRTANGEEFEYNERDSLAARRGDGVTVRYHYDSRELLTRCEMPTGEWRATYDPLGRRTSKTFGPRRNEFYWDTDRLAAEIQEDGRVRIYVYADAFAVTPILFVEYESLESDPASGRRYAIFSDHLGSPAWVEDDEGKVVWQARLDPYGAAHLPGNRTVELHLRFPGHYFDSETGLHYNRFRYYSPELGRYLQPDPLGVERSLNLYAYTGNPLKQVDVRGDEQRGCGNQGQGSEEPEKPQKGTNEEGTPARTRPKAWDDVDLTEDEFIAAYQARYPNSDLSRDPDRLRERYRAGDRLHPETGRLRHPTPPLEPTGTRTLPGEGTPEYERWAAYDPHDPNSVPCFPAGTLVKTPAGDRAIESLVKDEPVLAYDFESRSVVLSRITAIYKNWTQHIVVVNTDYGRLASTLSHPYWVEGESAWRPAVKLKAGMSLRLVEGESATVTEVATYAAEEDTYNFEVDRQNNYFVGLFGVLVHNGTGASGRSEDSKFADPTTYEYEIYEVRDHNNPDTSLPPDADGNHPGKVIYVGKTRR